MELADSFDRTGGPIQGRWVDPFPRSGQVQHRRRVSRSGGIARTTAGRGILRRGLRHDTLEPRPREAEPALLRVHTGAGKEPPAGRRKYMTKTENKGRASETWLRRMAD